jgi:hypothetical protein
MSSDPADSAVAPPPAPTIHAAERMPGPLGVVWYAEEIDVDAAVARRRAGGDVVVRGSDLDANRRLAQAIEAAVGAYKRGDPHRKWAGPFALPHYQQVKPPPDGHTFYETANRKARRRP